MSAIETRGLHKTLGGARVVDDLALTVPEGAVYGFVGPNGAGKTTAMRMLLGLLRPDGGSIRLLGQPMPGARLDVLARVGAFIETPGLYEHLSGRANLDLTRRLRGLAASEVDRALDLVELTHAADRRAGGYSLGMKQRLALARALMGTPRLLLLDEPTNGLDPDGIIAVRDLIRALPDRAGCTVFVSSHLLTEVEQMATHMGVMRRGRLVLEGATGDLLAGARAVRVAVDDAVRGGAVLRHAGFLVEDIGDGELRLPADGDPRTVAARATTLLVGAGLSLWSIGPEPRSLETLYRDTLSATPLEAAA